MGKAYKLVNVRDINALCQHYETYAQIEGQTRRRKITRALIGTPFHQLVILLANSVFTLGILRTLAQNELGF